MKVTAYYKDGSIEEYDTDSRFSDTNLFRTSGTCGVSCKLDLTNLGAGIYIEFWQHDLSDPVEVREGPDGDHVKLNYKRVLSRIRYFGHDQVLDFKRLSAAKSVFANDKMVLYRVQDGGKLVIWQRFTQLCELYLGNVDKMSYGDMAAQLFVILKGQNIDGSNAIGRMPLIPRLSDDEDERDWDSRIADAMGWDVEELLELVSNRRMLLLDQQDDLDDYTEIEDMDYIDG